jgi:glucose/arabinose dehydrogenase
MKPKTMVFVLPALLACGGTDIAGPDQEERAIIESSVGYSILVAETSSDCVRWIAGDGSRASMFYSGVRDPRGIAVEANGDIVVVELGGNLRRIAADGSGSSVFFTGLTRPTGIAVAFNGDLIVSEDGPANLWRIAADGSRAELIAHVRSEDVEIDAEGNFIVFAEGRAGQLLKVTPSGEISTLFSPLSNPTDLAIEGSGNYVVAEYDGTVRRIMADGSYDRVIATGLGALEGIAVADNGDLFVAEYNTGNVKHITADGVSVVLFTGLGAPDHLVVIQTRLIEGG